MISSDANNNCGRSSNAATTILCSRCRHRDICNNNKKNYCRFSPLSHMNRPYILIFFCCWFPFSFHIIHCYDGYTTCSKPFRTSRGRVDLPCDFNSQNWCIIPGSAYPWHAVRRFVFENHGLMKRMYGDQRHISVLRAEIDNDVEYNDGWHGYNNAAFKSRYEKSSPTPLRQASISSTTPTTTTTAPTASTTTTTAATTVISTSSTSVRTTTLGNLTYTNTPYNNNNTEEEEEEEIDEEELVDISSTETVLETTLAEEMMSSSFPSSPSSSSQSPSTVSSTTETSRPLQTQSTQQTIPSPEIPVFRHRGINACPVKEEVVAPFWANNTRGEILALLNLYPFEQYVHWERCTYENKQMYCRQGCRCEQQYRLYRLLAYDPTNDCRGIFSDWFKFPSCCVCKCYDLPADLRITSRSPRGKEPKFSVPASWNTL